MSWAEILVGNTGTGKSYFGRRLLKEQIRPRHLAIYHSPNEDDRYEFGPPLTLRELYRGERVPRSFQIVHASGLELLRALERALEYWEITVFCDEADQLIPNVNQAFRDPYTKEERQELRAWATNFMRRGRHGKLNCYFASPSIAGVHLEVWRFARTTHYFRQSEPNDLEAIETRYGPSAALQVARLRDEEHISVDQKSPPAGWQGHLSRLEARARRLG